ncbi:uroporphyrinogen decarboxylase family protein [Eisenbergiella sp.]
MSFKDGMEALNLCMPDRIPRTEYSASTHWDLVRAVTGMPVTYESSSEYQQAAGRAFVDAWNYDLFWNILTNAQIFGDRRTKMGHANYADGNVDFSADTSTLFDDPEDILRLDPLKEYGMRNKRKLTEEFNADYDKQRSLYPNTVAMTGIYVTCISGLIELFGWEMLLLAAGTDPRAFGEMTNRYCNWILQYFEALADSSAPVVMVHDDIVWTSGAFIHPNWYRNYVFPNYKKLFTPLHDAGKKILFTSDGTFTQFIDDIASCGVTGFVMEPTTDMAYIAEKYGRTHAFVGNVDTRILLYGTKQDIEEEVKRCVRIGKNCPGFFMAVGNHIPSNTPVENALWYNEFYEKYSRR